MRYFGWEHLKKYETQLWLILMIGLKDQQEDIVQNVQKLLEEAAENRKLLAEKYENLE